MTKKDYVLIAGAIKAAKQDISSCKAGNYMGILSYAMDIVQVSISKALLTDNSKFDIAKFKTACE